MSRLMLSTATAALLAAAPVCAALAANPANPPAERQSGSRAVQMSQSTQGETAPSKGPAAVRSLNEQSLKHSEHEATHSSHSGRHHTTSSHKTGSATHARATGGRTEQGDAAVEQLNEQSLSAAKAGRSVSGASSTGGVTTGGASDQQ